MDIDSLIFNSENFRHSCGGAHLLYGKSFAENCMEIKEIGLNRWGVPSTRPLSLDPSMLVFRQLMKAP